MRLPTAWFFFCALSLVLILSPGLTSAAVYDLTVGNYTLVSKTRIGRLDYELAFKATLTNRDQVSVAGATARLTNKPGIFVADGQLSFGRVDPGQTVWSTDTFTLRWPINQAISPKILQMVLCWQITSTGDAAPIANAGSDQTVSLGATVTLDGSDSSDPDGGPKPLAYRWNLATKPAGSAAVLSSTSTPNPSFLADKPGSYTIQLMVNDDVRNSTPDTVLISTLNSPPVAHAGPAQTVFVGTTVRLDGSGSSDIDGDSLTYHWALLNKPVGSVSELELADVTQVNPTLNIDKPGTYTLQLVVNDSTVDSAPATVILTTQNSRPVANAGPGQTVAVNALVTLDGSGSSDADGDGLAYDWSITSFPGATAPILSESTAVRPIFTPGLVGDYIATLIVNDGNANSDPATSLVTATVGAPVNNPPKIITSPVLVATVGSGYNYDVNAADADNDSLIFSLTTKPTGMTIDAQTGLINWTPGANQTDAQSVNVSVTDGKAIDSQHYTITVVPIGLITVPDLVNLSRTAAETAAVNAKLILGVPSFINNPATSGSVISQSPNAGASVAEGSIVTLTVSLGPDLGLPPDPANIAPKLDPTVATTVSASTEFLYSGSNPIQTGVAPGTIEARRVAVIRGKVLDKESNSLPGATITILNHPELGQTMSRADGMFDMAVNGGGLLTLNYRKDAYATAQRQVNTPWQDYALIDDVVLIQLDSKVTVVDLTNAATVNLVQANPVTDGDGTRQATLLFPVGTRATMTLADGSTTNLTTFHVRATEFTVGTNGQKTMPAALPPASGYTYEVEYSVDETVAAGATRVSFNHPIISYTENFVGFPVGTLVPYGEYDRNKGMWIASKNGRVIKILSRSQGLATLDLDGSGLAASAADLAALGVSPEEIQKLAVLYSSGTSLWRVPIDHFLALN